MGKNKGFSLISFIYLVVSLPRAKCMTNMNSRHVAMVKSHLILTFQ